MTIISPDIGLIYSLLAAKCIDLSLLIDYSTNFKDVIQDCYCQFSLVDWHSRFFTRWVWGLTITICNKITVHMHSKSNLIIGIAGYYTCSLLTRRKGDTFIIKGPFTFWNSPIWDFGGKDVFWQLFLRRGVGRWNQDCRFHCKHYETFFLILNLLVWKIETGVWLFGDFPSNTKDFWGFWLLSL